MENQNKLSKRTIGIGVGLLAYSLIFQTKESKKDPDSIQNVAGVAGALFIIIGSMIYLKKK